MTLALACCATAQDQNYFDEAIGILAKEQSLAESYASILKEFGKDNLKNYAEGIRLYANAKAEFDSLIEQMKYDLRKNEPIDKSSDFKAALNQAAEQRVAFTDFVTDKIIRGKPGRKNPLAVAAIAATPELIKALTEAGKAIWQEYRDGDKKRQQDILEHLETMKWRSFDEIAGSG